MGILANTSNRQNKFTTGTLYAPDANLYKITVKTAGAVAIDLQTEDAILNYDHDADANTPEIIAIGTVEAILQELSPLAYFIPSAANGEMFVILSKNDNDASELQTRIRRIGKDADPATTTSIGPNDIDISGSTVDQVIAGKDQHNPAQELSTSGTVTFTVATT